MPIPFKGIKSTLVLENVKETLHSVELIAHSKICFNDFAYDLTDEL